MTVHGEEPFDGIWLRLTATEPATCRIAADRDAVRTGLCTPAIPSRSPALADGDSLAYLRLRRASDRDSAWELGAIGHGAAGADLAHRICRQIHAWDHDRTAVPTITAHPADSPHPPTDPAIHKPHTILTVTF